MKKEKFAEALGFGDYIKLLDSSEVVYVEGDVTWYVTKLQGGRWAAWDDAELAIDRVSYCKDKEEALYFQKAGVQVREQNTTAREFIESLETSVSLEKALFYLGQYTGKGNHYVSFPDANIPDDVDPIEFAEYLAEQDNETFDLNENGDFFFDYPEKEKFREILSTGEYSIYVFWYSPVRPGEKVHFSCYSGKVFLVSEAYDHGPFNTLEEAEEFIFNTEKADLDSCYEYGGETSFWRISPDGEECSPPDFSMYGYRTVEGPSDYWWIEPI